MGEQNKNNNNKKKTLIIINIQLDRNLAHNHNHNNNKYLYTHGLLFSHHHYKLMVVKTVKLGYSCKSAENYLWASSPPL